MEAPGTHARHPRRDAPDQLPCNDPPLNRSRRCTRNRASPRQKSSAQVSAHPCDLGIAFSNFSLGSLLAAAGNTDAGRLGGRMPSPAHEPADPGDELAQRSQRRRTLPEPILCGRSPAPPVARAVAGPEVVCTEMGSGSAPSKAGSIPRTCLPEEVVVSVAAPCRVRDAWPMPRSVTAWTVFARWRRSRPNGSSRHGPGSLACTSDRLPGAAGRPSYWQHDPRRGLID